MKELPLYKTCIEELLTNEVVYSMKHFIQHGNVSCLEHSLYVSYCSFRVAKIIGWDYISCARGGLLHDLFLYDWHETKSPYGLHGFTHAYAALENATHHFVLNEKEQDIIKKHMWPLTFLLPKFKETYLVLMVDKWCATMEILKWTSRIRTHQLMRAVL